MSIHQGWPNLTSPQPDVIVALDLRAKEAPEPKLSLVAGAYRDENGKPYPLPVVRKAAKLLAENGHDYEYLRPSGDPAFISAAVDLVFRDSANSLEGLPAVPGCTIPSAAAERCNNEYHDLVAFQTVSGTGALNLAMNFIASTAGAETRPPVYLSDPTWPNHHGITHQAGYTDVRTYRYYDPATRGLDFAGMTEDLKAAPEGSIVVLHQCAHNPTGVDPTKEQWCQLAELLAEKNHIVIFDSAYLGFASASFEVDAFPCRYLRARGQPFILTQSFSKNLGLYSERLGLLVITLADPSQRSAVAATVDVTVRTQYGGPVGNGARIARIVLSDPELRAEWERELVHMSGRIRKMRELLVAELKRLGVPGDWSHVTSQIGMFSYLGLTKEQCQYCIDHNVFILLSGRCNMAAVTEASVPLLAKTIHDAIAAHPFP